MNGENRQRTTRMVDVSGKENTYRLASARGVVKMHRETLQALKNGLVPKGNVLETARIAGIMAVKRTAEIIPLCHPLTIDGARVDFTVDGENSCVHVEAEVTSWGRTGVEMEALTAVSAACLTIYDMCKTLDKEMMITEIRLVRKSGGRSGEYIRGGERWDE